MSEKNVRTLSHASNRSQPRDLKDKKVAFKGVLDTPFRIQWPSVPSNIQRISFESIVGLLEGASEYHQRRCSATRKRKRASKTKERLSQKKKSTVKEKEQPSSNDIEEVAPIVEQAPMDLDQDEELCPDEGDKIEPPPFLRHVLYGINSVTKRLEDQTLSARQPNILSLPETTTIPPKPLKYIFVCRGDVDPPLLIDHLPHLVAAYNSARPSQYVKLVPLPKGSEIILARILGIRRVTVLGIDVDYPMDSRLESSLESIPILAASWLSQATPIKPLVQTHIKLLKTTAPKDMKLAKESRLQGKAAAKRKAAERLAEGIS